MLRHHVKGLAFLAIAAALLLLPAGVAYAGKGGSGGKGSGGGMPSGGVHPSTVHPSTVHPSTVHPGVKTAQKGTMRPFVSPTLKPGKEYTYEIKAQWQEGGQIYNETRQLTVRPGEQYGFFSTLCSADLT